MNVKGIDYRETKAFIQSLDTDQQATSKNRLDVNELKTAAQLARSNPQTARIYDALLRSQIDFTECSLADIAEHTAKTLTEQLIANAIAYLSTDVESQKKIGEWKSTLLLTALNRRKQCKLAQYIFNNYHVNLQLPQGKIDLSYARNELFEHGINSSITPAHLLVLIASIDPPLKSLPQTLAARRADPQRVAALVAATPTLQVTQIQHSSAHQDSVDVSTQVTFHNSFLKPDYPVQIVKIGSQYKSSVKLGRRNTLYLYAKDVQRYPDEVVQAVRKQQ